MAKPLRIDQRLRRRLLPIALLLISAVMFASLAIRQEGIRHHHFNVATESARNIFRMIVLTRQWNANHGGVYVFESAQTPVNEYLQHPQKSISLDQGRTLVLLNPAYMTRQIAELAEQDPTLRLRLHITSLKPIRPANSPDPWEVAALNQFEQGIAEVASIEDEAGIRYLRYMAPLEVKQPCLACHEKQGYQLGDIRGGISVSLPFQAMETAVAAELAASLTAHGAAYGLLILITWGLTELLARRWRNLDDTIATLRATRDQLVESEKMASLGRLVAGFAHEINTPIGIAVGAVTHGSDNIQQLRQLVTQDEVSEQALNQQLDDLAESQQLAFKNLRRAAELVQRFKRTSIDRSSQDKRSYRLREAIEDVQASLVNTLKHSAVTIEIDCDPAIQLYGTPGYIEQVFTNLINNSLMHGFADGTQPGKITITATQDKQPKVLIDFADNGAGMREDVRQQAFEPFFTTGRERGGSGLGLYVIYNIVTQQMGGTIHIKSTPSAGTHFHLELPLEQPPETPRAVS